MAGILDYQGLFYQLGPLSTQQFRNSILSRNLPPPVNETLTLAGLVSKLDDIGTVINVPIFGTADENIPIHYNEDERLFPLGTFFRTTQNVNYNPYIPQDDVYDTYGVITPPNLGYPQPTEFGQKERGPYPTSYVSDRFELVSKGVRKGVGFPFNVIDQYKSLNFQKESSLGLIGGAELEKSIINKIAQIEEEANPNINGTGWITEPVGNIVDNYVNRLRGNDQFFNTLPNDAVGWNEYNSSNIINGGTPDGAEGVAPSMSLEKRMKSLLEKTSKEQVQFTFDLLKRNSYRPLYEDSRFVGTSTEGTNGRYYIGTEKSTNRGSLVTKTFDSSDFNGETNGNTPPQRTTIEGIDEPFGEPNKFFWTTGGEQNFNPKTLLYKTQQLVNNSQDEVFINQTRKFFKDKKQKRLISRGNAISEFLLIDAESNGKYCRVWTVNDRYSYLRAIRKTGLFTSPDGTLGFSNTSEKASLSVLMENGIPKYHPVANDSTTTRKKFMFSIENLAWTDNLADLPLSEIGPGDVLTGNKGRIMWFPPYGLTFDESTTANWTPNEFIGRSEPVFTYNNSTRSGSISFKLLVDHPRVINGYRGKSNNLIERFFAGCETPQDFLQALDNSTSQLTKAEVEKKLKQQKAQKASVTQSDPKTGQVDYTGTGETDYNSSQLDSLVTEIQTYVDGRDKETNPEVKITLKGLGSTSKIAKDRAKTIKRELKDKVKGKKISYSDTRLVTDSGNYVEVKYNIDSKNSDSAKPKAEEKKQDSYDPQMVKLIDSIIIDENSYFEYIDNNYPNYFKTISERIKYFYPGFHSITPEGFNSRLTFLNQCMRQGPSIYDKGSDIRPQNLSFGRPPICILRIGDFFHTKIKINSLSISYDGPQFDLNPEGIGVQPMIATIQLSIDLIGGHSLTGPINRLQNAVSFNYYANTEVYDARADFIKDGVLKDGVKLSELKRDAFEQGGLDKLIEDLKKEGTKDQEKNAQSSDNSEGDGKNVIEIIPNNSNLSDLKIDVKIKDGKTPGEVIVGKEANANNSLECEIKIEGEDPKPKNTKDSTLPITSTEISTKLLSPTELKSKQDTLDTLKLDLELAKTDFQNDSNTQNLKKVNDAKDKVKKQEDDIKQYKKETVDKVKVIAYLTENKTKTKVTKSFTITENGLT